MCTNIEGMTGAFAVRIADRRLEPAARMGATLYADPRTPGGHGDLVVVTTSTGARVVGLMHDISDDGLVILASLSPAATESVPASDIASIGKVVLIAHP